MDDLPTPVRHTAHGNLPESCRISSPSPEAMNFVLVMFTWRPLDSNPSFHALTRSTHSSREVAMITRSSAKNSSQGTPTLKSLDKASSTMIKSSGLRTEPWCTPTPTSNSSLYSQPTLTWLRALLYIACTRRTIHSSTPTFLIAHHKTFRGTRSNAFSRSTKAKNRVRFLSFTTPTGTSCDKAAGTGPSGNLCLTSHERRMRRDFLRVGHLLTLTTTLESKFWRMQPSHDVGTNSVKAVL